MKYVNTRSFVATLIAVTLASCSGGGHQIPSSPQSAPTVTAPQLTTVGTSVVAMSAHVATYALPLPKGYSGSISLSAENAPANAKLTLRALQPVAQPASSRAKSSSLTRSCPPPPTISIENPFPFPITIRLQSFTIRVFCNVNGNLFGLSMYQTNPQPSTITSLKLGDATANGNTIAFTPTVTQLTFPAKTTSALAILPETSTSEVGLPVVAGATSVLTSNPPPNLHSSLSFLYTSASGGTAYGTACFKAHDATGALVAALQGVPIAGTPSFYCQVDPGTSSINFGQIVKFFVGSPLADRSVFGFDGPSSPAYVCNGTSASVECDTPAFNVPNFKNLIVSNAKDLALCVPVTDNTDCNNISGSPSPPPSTLTVPKGQDFQFLVADDPSYHPGTPAAPLPWSGLLGITASGACQVNNGSDNDNGDEPPGYTDANQTGVGPNAEFDITASNYGGTCTLTITEDPNYITEDFSNPQNPVGRSATLNVTVH
jgi:hypothetical protein